MRSWTENQKKAITASGGSLIVSAAAGSGKTAVLVERATLLILDEENGVAADRLLIVTYTRAAAKELKERLNIALSELIAKNPADRHLLKQQALLSKAPISTIHSFCQSVVKEYFYVLDIDRNFRIADDSELFIIKSDALKLTLDELYAKRDEGFYTLVESFSSHRDDSRLGENILKIYEFLRSHPFPKRWMEEKLSYYDSFSDVSSSVWGEIIEDYTKDAMDHLVALLDSSVAALSLDEAFLETLPLFERDGAFLERLKAAVEKESWDEIGAALSSFEKGRMKVKKGYSDHPLKLKASANRDDFKKTVETLSSLYRRSYDDCLSDIAHLKFVSEAMFSAVRLFGENFAALKKEKKVADFSDLEHWMLDLLLDEKTGEKTELAEQISSRFDAIMVDEFQDANETQDTLFQALSKNEENLFFVGDVKQSIYGFRQAMPELFLKRKNNAVLYDEAAPVFPAKIILEKNFRSAAPVIEAVNFYFSRLMSPTVGEIDYNDEEKLVKGAEYRDSGEADIELDLVDIERMGEVDAVVAEAKFIAERILKLISSRYRVKDRGKDGEVYRDVTFSDFSVLMRVKTASPVFVDILSRYSVKAQSASSHRFLESYEIMVISNFLRVINNPALDVELLSVLMCPVFAFTEDDIVRIRLFDRKASLFNALKADADNGGEKSKRFLDELFYYRTLSATVELKKLIRVIYERSAFFAVMSASSSSTLAMNNLRLFLDYARRFEQNTSRGLSSFVSYLDRLLENDSDLPGAVALSDADLNAVQVMSIHASKGLEFPVVFLSNTARKFNSDTGENVLLHSKYGMALKRKDTRLSAFFDTMPREALKLEIKRAEMSEELRVLYVAMTRARQKLIMTAALKDSERYVNRIASKLSGENALSPYLVRSATLLSDWLVMVALLHPDAKNLRDLCTAEVIPEKRAAFSLSANLITSSVFEENEEESGEEVQIPPARGVIDELLAHESFVYPFQAATDLPVKVAASTLAHRKSTKAFDRILSSPAFLSDKTLSAADRGTALHAFMQYADFSAARADIGAELKRLKDEGYLSSVQCESIDLEKANRFIRSSLVDRCLKAEKVFKEYRFTVKIPASVLDPAIEAYRNEEVVLQGAVDLAFVEDGELVIVDYKTDRVKSADLLLGMYSFQLKLYQDALEKCLALPVKECLIYSVYLGEAVEVRVDDT